MRNLTKLFVYLAIIVGFLYLQPRALAQYTAIPAETSNVSVCPSVGTVTDVTQCAGYRTRADMNDRLSGVKPIAPSFVTQSVASTQSWPSTVQDLYATSSGITLTLPACTSSTIGMVRDLINGTAGTITIAPNGSDAINGVNASVTNTAQYTSSSFKCVANGAWNQGGSGSGGGAAFPLTANVSAASHKVQNLALDTATGDALSRNQSSLSALTSPSASFNMSSQKFTTMGPGTSAGDSIAQNQSGVIFQDLNSSINGSINPMSANALVAGTTNTFLAMGADPTGVADSTTAINNALLAECGITTISGNPLSVNGNYRPPVILPRGLYLHTSPLQMPCGSEVFKGDGPHSTQLKQNYYGPAIIQLGYQANPLTFSTPLIGATGQSLQATTVGNIQNGGSPEIFISDVLNGSYKTLANLNQFSLEFWFKQSTAGAGDVTALMNANPSKAAISGLGDVVYRIQSNGSSPPTYTFQLQTTGSGIQNIVCNITPSIGTAHDLAIDLHNNSGSGGSSSGTFRAFVDGTACSSTQTMTGTIYQSLTAVASLPEVENGWPDQYNGGISNTPGYFDSYRVEQVSEHSSNYSNPSAKFGNDVNTLFLDNFASGTDGTQLAVAGNGTPAYLPIRGQNGGSSGNRFVGNQILEGMDLCAVGSADGVFTIFNNNGVWKDLECSGVQNTAFNFYKDNYESRFDNIATGSGGNVGIEFGHNSNGYGTNLYIDSPYGACYADWSQGGLQHQLSTYCAPRGNTAVGYYLNSVSGYYKTGMDEEQANANHLTDIFLDGVGSPAGALVVDGTQLYTLNGAPFIMVNGGSPSPTLENMQFSSFGASVKPPELIDILNDPNQGGAILGMNLSTNYPQVPWTNEPGDPWLLRIGAGNITTPINIVGTVTATTQGISFADQPVATATVGAGSITFNLTGAPKQGLSSGGDVELRLCQDGTGHSGTVVQAFPTATCSITTGTNQLSCGASGITQYYYPLAVSIPGAGNSGGTIPLNTYYTGGTSTGGVTGRCTTGSPCTLADNALSTQTSVAVTFGGISAIKWASGLSPLWTVTAGKCDVVKFSYDPVSSVLSEISRSLNE